jgi:hypothetical protein
MHNGFLSVLKTSFFNLNLETGNKIPDKNWKQLPCLDWMARQRSPLPLRTVPLPFLYLTTFRLIFQQVGG